MVNVIEETLSTKIRPILAEHNGDIELIKVCDGVVEVKLLGACSGCPSAMFTMSELVESTILEIPNIKEVKLIDNISEEMYSFARQLLTKDKDKM